MNKVIKYILALNSPLALVGLLGSAWVARSAGSSAYLAGALAVFVVGTAASVALLLSYFQSRQLNKDNAVAGVLLAMLFRMGLPIAVAILMQQTNSPLLQAGFMGLLTLCYLVALPIETAMSLQFIKADKPKVPGTTVSGQQA